MAVQHDHGKQGEALAKKWLIAHGYIFRAANYRFGKYEIDLIMEKGPLIVVVEVKSRQAGGLEHPSEALSKRQQGQIIKAANAWLEEHECDLEVRLDLITVLLGPGDPVIEHYPDAFYPEA